MEALFATENEKKSQFSLYQTMDLIQKRSSDQIQEVNKFICLFQRAFTEYLLYLDNTFKVTFLQNVQSYETLTV